MAVIAQGVSVNPEIMDGQPCLVGQRWPTYIARMYAKAGYSVAAMQREFPQLTAEQIADALAWEFQPKKVRDEIVKASLAATQSKC
jgi:uncharacterized protein (DUF433 family)